MAGFDAVFERFGPDVAPFMHRMRADVSRHKPFAGLSIVHDIPLTTTTLLKLDCLRLGGARLLVSNYSYCTPDPSALAVLEDEGIPFKPVDQISGTFDILMDCGAELLGRCEARLGAIELTRTGAVTYDSAAPAYPVVSVDDTRLKQLETCLGTGEGVYRAIKALTGKDLDGARLVLFGFGKVGRGIAHYFARAGARISVIEMLAERLQVAAGRGFDAVAGSHKNEVEDLVASADVVVTATGRKNLISELYDLGSFRQGAVLANAGAEDEFGPAFGEDEVLFGKGPVNFSQEEPTLMPFLDPIFYAHNMAIFDLLARPAAGFYPLSKAVDDAVMTDWCKFHARTEAELERIFGP